MTDDPKKNAAPVGADGRGKVSGADDHARSGADDDIEILEVTAADEAGVPLEDDADDDPDDDSSEDGEAVVIDDEDDEEFEVGGEAFDMSSPRSRADDAVLSAEAAVARAQVLELREQLLRTTADFDNFRKRVERDRVEERKQATAGVVRNILPVLDSFRWALVSAQKGEVSAVKAFAEGFQHIETQLIEILKSAGLESVESVGIFDPTVHEALMQETTHDKPHMTVLEVFEPGWRLGGRLLRPARVKVANNPSGYPASNSTPTDSSAPSDGPGDSGPSKAEPETTL